jgi:hypothetical protein
MKRTVQSSYLIMSLLGLDYLDKSSQIETQGGLGNFGRKFANYSALKEPLQLLTILKLMAKQKL